MIRIQIVDDEMPARKRLAQILAAYPDVEIVGEAGSGAEAMQLAAELKPDLMLLDIQMPGASGLDVAACLPYPRPRIIFCTAFDEHAVDAFELNAVDYLLKPISRARLNQALERVRALSPDRGETAVDNAVRSRRSGPARFLVKSAARYVVVGEARVLYFASEDGLTRLVSDGAEYWMDPTLNELEQRLDPARFFRISRAALIHLNAVSEVCPMPGGSGELVMRNGKRLEVSRRRFRDLLGALAN